jgi:hypothetical protein
MAKIKIRIPTLDSVDEALQGFYTEDVKNGGFILQAEADEKGLGIGMVSSLRGKLDEATRKEAKVKGMLLTKEDDSLWTREEVEGIVAEMALLKETNTALSSKTKGGEDLLKQQVAAAKGPLQTENTELKAAVARYKKSVHEAEAGRVVDSVLKMMKPQERWESLMRRDLASHIQVEEVDGKMVSKFVDPVTGAVRFSSQSDNDGPMGPKEFATNPELLKQYADCLEGDGKSGAGLKENEQTKGGRDRANPTPSKKDVSISKTDANNFELWVDAAELAAKQGGTVVIVEDE